VARTPRAVEDRVEAVVVAPEPPAPWVTWVVMVRGPVEVERLLGTEVVETSSEDELPDTEERVWVLVAAGVVMVVVVFSFEEERMIAKGWENWKTLVSSSYVKTKP
jgi:hypothetical protein